MLRFLGRAGYTEVETVGNDDWTARRVPRRAPDGGPRAASGDDGPDSARRTRAPCIRRCSKTRRSSASSTMASRACPRRRHGPLGRPSLGSSPRPAIARPHDLELPPEPRLRVPEQGQRAAGLRHPPAGKRPPPGEVRAPPFWITEGGSSVVEYLSADPVRTSGTMSRTTSGSTTKADGTDEAIFEDVGPGMLASRTCPMPVMAAGSTALLIEHDCAVALAPERRAGRVQDGQAGIQFLRDVRS